MESDKIYVQDFMAKEEEKTKVLSEENKRTLWKEKQASFNISCALGGFMLK